MVEIINRRLNILYVEDDAEDFLIVGELIKTALGDQVTLEWMENPAQELQDNPLERYHLVLVDLLLRMTDGLEVIRQIKNKREDLPIILVTGFCNPRVLEKAREMGVRHCLDKGELSGAMFVDAIREALSGASDQPPALP